MSGSILVIDQGTTSTRSIVFGPDALPVAIAQEEFPQFYLQSGWVEHDPRDLWRTALSTARIVLAKAADKGLQVAALGIANQRETALLWDRETGQPIHRAIVWQDRRTAPHCARLRAEGAESLIQARTGLVLDPYFSATKIAWLLDNVPGARARAERGELAFGTIDTLPALAADGRARPRHRCHQRVAHGALRHSPRPLGCRSPEAVPGAQKPASGGEGQRRRVWNLRPNRTSGTALPIRSLIGDQQAALIGQACFEPGMVKATYGTGAFVLMNTGETPRASPDRLLTTIAYQLKGKRTYALEGSIFAAGASVQWLRDGLSLVRSSAETSALAAQSDPDQAVYLVPAFVGLGAPIWDPDARGTIVGLTRGTTRREIARAALESVAYQTGDLLRVMRPPEGLPALRADGGMSASDWTMQSVADLVEVPVERPAVIETTGLGAAYLAGWQSGLYPDPPAFAKSWRLERRFSPAMDAQTRRRKLDGWRDAVARTVLRP